MTFAPRFSLLSLSLSLSLFLPTHFLGAAFEIRCKMSTQNKFSIAHPNKYKRNKNHNNNGQELWPVGEKGAEPKGDFP